MKKQKEVKNNGQSSVPSTGSLPVETKVEGTKEQNTCGQCKWYDVSTQREFRRDGIRPGLVETRAICKASKDHSKASNHLVKKESARPCFEVGTYVAPVKEKAEKKEQSAEPKREHVEEKPQRKKHIKPAPNVVTATKVLNGNKKQLEMRPNGKVYVNA